MGFETVTDYLPVPTGAHLLELRPSGAASTTPAVVSTQQQLDSGVYYTAAGLGPRAALTAGLFVDGITAPSPGTANVRFVHAAVGAPDVDVTFGANALQFTDAGFARATPYQPIAAGAYDIGLTGDTGIALVDSQSVEFTVGVTYTVAAIGGGGQSVRVLPVVDARAAATLPIGGLATGAGGTADEPVRDARPWFAVAGAVAGAVIMVTATTGAFARSRRARRS